MSVCLYPSTLSTSDPHTHSTHHACSCSRMTARVMRKSRRSSILNGLITASLLSNSLHSLLPKYAWAAEQRSVTRNNMVHYACVVTSLHVFACDRPDFCPQTTEHYRKLLRMKGFDAKSIKVTLLGEYVLSAVTR